ncbi:hypothetical protein PF005_g22151 [Phytophthora fragariae]|uniref:Uncharacterized protein n=1 Tax=Phytophthora fragariae TaxID=53985 RepID=A0A6A3WNR3_9STRA|nr:hypothetical protein PF003_g31215 [Phytophthora fragariae]KAE9021064.1 hypothetical protein PF011_g5111 [Phytophthora fragariae]KAE9097710.1 hypothetical protein PF006_g23514 [Phytophthora fragariae]KAE9127833.1 hypothetical protein PF010_g4731 [Phytophthora fragariae]KAE9183287.1 hypothetical protein PF005_g22151 [Phytophthora fragariae]
MRKVTCIITETEEDEFLLGRLTLKALGIDVEERKRELFEVVMRYDIWRIAIGNDPPSKIEPFIIQFKEGTLPMRCRPRTYAPAEREW